MEVRAEENLVAFHLFDIDLLNLLNKWEVEGLLRKNDGDRDQKDPLRPKEVPSGSPSIEVEQLALL